MFGEGCRIVRNQHALLVCGPLKYCGVVSSRETDILNPDDVEIRLPAHEAADNIVVEVFVCPQSQHNELEDLPTAVYEAIAYAGRVEPLLVLLADLPGLLLALRNVRLDLGLVT